MKEEGLTVDNLHFVVDKEQKESYAERLRNSIVCQGEIEG